MKIYISVDMEGICGSTNWDEVTKGKDEYPAFQKQMTAEVVAACEGAFAAGAREILIRDAHDSARNLIASELPQNTTLVRGWSRHPYMMMQELDSTFDAALMIGYHSFAGGGGNPLAHTMNSKISLLTINDQPASEFLINWYTALYEKVPAVFIAGDQEICDHANEYCPAIHSLGVKKGSGDSSINLHPNVAAERIAEGVEKSLSGDLTQYLQELPEYFEVTISYTQNQDAYKSSFFPGARLIQPRQVGFESDNYFDVLSFFLFTL